MKIQFSNITFGDNFKIYQKGNNKIKERYDDNNILLSRTEYDEFDRAVDTKRFGISGEVNYHLHKEYTDSGYVETFKDDYQEYIRKTFTKIEDSFKHRIEEYISKTRPEKNYVNDFVYDLAGKLVKIFNNGNAIDLKK